MFSLFAFTAIILGFAIKLIGESSRQSKFERHHLKGRDLDHLLWDRACEEQKKICDALEDEKRRWEFLESVSDELSSVYGVDWRKRYLCWKVLNKNLVKSDWGEPYKAAVLLLLARRGCEPIVMSDQYKIRDLKNNSHKIRLCKMIEQNIKNYYPDINQFTMVVKYGIVDDYYNSKNHMVRVDHGYCTVYWAHRLPSGFLKNSQINGENVYQYLW